MLQHMPLGQFGSLEKCYVIFKNLKLIIYFPDEQEVDRPLERGLAVVTTRVVPQSNAPGRGREARFRQPSTK